MSKLGVLAVAGMLFLGLSGSASAGPIIVTYALTPGAGATALYNPGVLGTPGTGFAGGNMTVVYASGTTALGGALGSVGSMQLLIANLITPGVAAGNSVPGIVLGPGAGVLNVGNNGAVTGSTAVTASFFGPGVPGVSWAGPVNIPFTSGGTKTINIGAAAGTQVLLGFNILWTISNVVGTEVSRVAVPMPEPAAGALLVMGLVGLAAFRAPKRRRE